MCGVVGIATSAQNGFRSDEVQVFRDLIFLDTMRGYDSTGVMGMDKHGNVVVHKEASMGPVFINSKTFDEFKTDLFRHGLFAAAHNRAATRGSITDKNAHPFIVDDKIVLMQNGTYKGDHTKHKDTEVDTEAVAHVISETPDVEKALKKINASYAFVWFNAETKQLNLIRNSERPLWMLTTDQGSLVWASESAFLYMALNRNGVKFSGKAEEVPVHTLITLTVDGSSWKREDKKLQCEYTFPVQVAGTRTFTAALTEEDYEMWDLSTGMAKYTYPMHNNGWRKPHDVHSVHTIPNPQTLEVNLPFHSSIVAEKYSEYHLEMSLAHKTAQAVANLSWKSEHCVEILDYLPGNTLPGCRVWYVFGHFVYEDASSNAVVYFMVNNKSEQEVIEMVGDTWYMGRIASQAMADCVYKRNEKVPCVFGHTLTQFSTQSVATQ